MRAYAVGDIHGHLGLLQGVHDLIATDMARNGAAPVVHVGDLVDRGADSRGVIDWLMQGINAGRDWVVLKGNHDRMFWRFLRDPNETEPGLRPDLSWLHPRLGGVETLQSYGVRSPGDRPVAAVHAGIRPGVALEKQTETDMIWLRAPFLDFTGSFGPLVIHGHTAIDAATHYGNRVNIDSSAAYGGPLSAVAVEGREVFLLTPRGRVPLQPAG